jgi:hypothetical protein
MVNVQTLLQALYWSWDYFPQLPNVTMSGRSVSTFKKFYCNTNQVARLSINMTNL